MAVFRFLAWLLLLLATIALVADITRLANGVPNSLTTSLAYWKSASPQTLSATATFVQRSLHPLLWDPVAVRVLLLPVWLLVGAVGLVLAILGRRKRRINIFAN